MKLNDVRKMAKGLDINTYRMKKADMIRSIQYAEHNIPCFGTERMADCREDSCLWRTDCMAVSAALTGDSAP
ncbi:MAG: Rho termination factor N-terminal domain-containing protein [Desulfatiglandaceae bacterium]